MFFRGKLFLNQLYKKVETYGLLVFFFVGFALGCGGSYVFGGVATKNLQLLPFVVLFVAGPLLALIFGVAWGWKSLEQKKTKALLLASTGYMTGSFLLLLWTYLHKVVGVEFATTFPEILHENLVFSMISILGAPLQILGIEFDPSTMISSINIDPKDNQNLGRLHWRNWVLGTMFFYGILPRMLLLTVSFMLGRKAEKLQIQKRRIEEFAIGLEKDGDPFEIDSEELRLLLSLQAMIVRKDIETEQDSSKKKAKMLWYTSWKSLQKKVRDVATSENSILKNLDEDEAHLLEECVRLTSQGYKKMGMLYLETALFQPYFDLKSEERAQKQQTYQTKPSDFDQSVGRRSLLQFIATSGFAQKKFSAALSSYEEIVDDLMSRKQIKSLGYWLGGAFLATGLGLTLGPAFLAAIGLKGAIVKLLSSLALGSGVLILAKIGAAKGLLLVVCGGSLWSASHKIADIYGFRGGAERIVKDIAKFEATILHFFNLDYKDALQLIEKKLIDSKNKIAQAITEAPESQSKKELKKCQAAIEHRLAKK